MRLRPHGEQGERSGVQVPGKDHGDLCTGRGVLREQLAVRAVDEASGDRPVHGLQRVAGDVLCVGEARELAVLGVLLVRIAVEDDGDLLAGDRIVRGSRP